jgi:phage terminase large subunit-like protein
MATERDALEQTLLLARELDRRRADDPLVTWVALPRQKPYVEAVLSGATHTNWFIAANRAGKSEALAYCIAQLARFGPPERPNTATTGWVVSLDANTSRDIIQPKLFDNGYGPPGLKPFIPKREIHDWKVADQILRLKNGSIIGFKNSESERVKFQGVEKDYVAFDEEPPKDRHDEAVIRVGGGRRLRVFGAVTLLPPEGQVGGVSWLFTELIQPWQLGQRPGYGLFGSSIYDNPHLMPAEIARLESVYPPGTPQHRIRLGGEWLPGLSGARAYGNFERVIHVRPQLWPPLPRRPLCFIWDFNVEPLLTLIGQRDGRVFRVLKELAMDEGTTGQMLDWFRSEVPGHHGELWIYGDATGKSRDGQTGQSDYTLIQNGLRTYGSPVRLKVPEANPLQKDRINAVNRVLKDERGANWVEIDPSCAELIKDLEQVITDGRGGIKKTFNRRDPYYRRTHASDAFGYWIYHEEPVTSAALSDARPAVELRQPGYGWATRLRPR